MMQDAGEAKARWAQWSAGWLITGHPIQRPRPRGVLATLATLVVGPHWLSLSTRFPSIRFLFKLRDAALGLQILANPAAGTEELAAA